MREQAYTDDRELKIEAALGEEAHRFFVTPIGEYVINRSLQEVAEQQQRFEAADPEDHATLKDIHFRTRLARHALEWLNEALLDGERAYQMLRNESQ